MTLPLTIGMGPPLLPLTPLVIATVFVSLSAITQVSLIRYQVWGVSMVSTSELLLLTSSIALSWVRGSVTAVTNRVGFRDP